MLLTWNPGPGDDFVWTPDEWRDDVVARLSGGESIASSWGVGNHVHHIEPGDVAFLYRQGAWGRGIVARGTVESRPWRTPHWDEAKARNGGTTNCVDVVWREGLPVDLAIEVAELEAVVPELAWRQVYSSGRRLPSDRAAARLRGLWEDHLRGFRDASR